MHILLKVVQVMSTKTRESKKLLFSSKENMQKKKSNKY